VRKSVDELIGEIRGLARGKLDDTQLSAVLDEVRTHLDLSIQSRLELGQQVPEAQHEAIVSFGDPKVFVQGLEMSYRAKETPIQASFFLAALVMICGALSALPFERYSSLIPLLLLQSPLLIGVIALAVIGWKRARPQLSAMFTALAVAIPVCTLLVSFFASGNGTLDFTDKRELIAVMQAPDIELQRQREWNENFRIAFEKGYLLDHKGSGPFPVFVYGKTDGVTNQYLANRNDAAKISSIAEMKAYWAGRQEVAKAWESSVKGLRLTAAAAQAQFDRPYWLNALLCLPAAAASTASMWLILFIAHVLAAWGAMLRRARNRGRGEIA